jgi:glutathione S-transferase
LSSRQYVTGDNVTIADIAIGVPLFHSLRLFLVENDRKENPNVVSFVERLAA